MFPNGKLRLVWEFLIFIVFIIIIFTDPLSLAFPEDMEVINYEILLILESLMFADMVLQFITTSRKLNGRYETSPLKIITSYFFGRFLFDFLPLYSFFRNGTKRN